MAFLVKLLVDLNNKETNNTFAKKNQITRAEIIKTIESDLNNKTISAINDNSSTSDTLFINFLFNDNTNAQMKATKEQITYLNSDGETRKWTLKDGNVYVNKAHVYLTQDKKDSGDSLYTMIIDLEIHTSNEKNTTGNNNTLDDILISYLGNTQDYQEIITCLGYEC